MQIYQKTTRSPILIDNEILIQADARMQIIQEEQKIISGKFQAIAAGIDDSYLHSFEALDNLKSCFIGDEYYKHLNYYFTGKKIYKSCTSKQKNILYMLFVQKLRICDISRLLEISSSTVIDHKNAILKKVLKQKINLN